MTNPKPRRLRPQQDGGVWGAYVGYLERLEAERDEQRAQIQAARAAAQRLLKQEQQHAGSGRDGHLNEDDLVPLFEALGVVYLDGTGEATR